MVEDSNGGGRRGKEETGGERGKRNKGVIRFFCWELGDVIAESGGVTCW